jgi:hypothetical protein
MGKYDESETRRVKNLYYKLGGFEKALKIFEDYLYKEDHPNPGEKPIQRNSDAQEKHEAFVRAVRVKWKELSDTKQKRTPAQPDPDKVIYRNKNTL